MSKKYYFIFREGSRINQILCAILINLPVFAYGASIGWMSPMTLLLQSKDSPRNPPLTDYEVSLMGAVSYLTCIAADFLMAWVADKFGRKAALLLMSSTSVVAWIIKLSSMETWAFITARALMGIPMGAAYVACPPYIREISENCIRGLLGSMLILAHTSGNLFLYIIGDVMAYRPVLWVCLALPTIHLVLFLVMPESPSYLIKTGKIEEATRVMAWLRCKEEDDITVIAEVNDIRKEQKHDEGSSKFAFKALLTDKILFRAFRIAIVIALAREVCGAIPVLMFAGEIFAKASKGTSNALVLTPNQQAMMLGAVQVAGSALASSVIERTGRKVMFFITCLISGLSMFGLASWFLAKQFNAPAPAWIPVVALCLCIFCDSSGLGPLSVVIAGEMFSFKYRGTVLAFTMALAALFDFFQILFFMPLANIIGLHVAFYFFALVCVLSSVYVILVIPETKMRSVAEIQNFLRTKKEKERDLVVSREAEAKA